MLLKARTAFLTCQQEALLAAKQQLVAQLQALEATVCTRFMPMLAQTNSAFVPIFPQMFGGGHAHFAQPNPEAL